MEFNAVADFHYSSLFSFAATAIAPSPREVATHLAFSSLSALGLKHAGVHPTVDALTAEAQALLPDGTPLPAEFSDAVGEM